MSLRGSIRLRLGLAAALTILIALGVGGLVLSAMFDRQVNRLAEIDLADRSVMLMSGLQPNAPDAAPADTIGGDPRYLRPYSGYYWQIDIGGRSYRSQSLWDAVLPLGPQPTTGAKVISTGQGPDGQSLMILDRMILLGPAQVPVRLSVAIDRHSLTEAQALFTRDLVPFLAALGGLLLLAALIQITVGLRPFGRIRQRISELRSGARGRLGRDLVREVEPLAQEIDALLDDRDARIDKARHRAADLAHTLKTPLQALMGEAGRLREGGHAAPARAISDIVDQIRQRLDHELGRDRIAGRGVSDPQKIARSVADVLARTARGQEIAIDVAVDAQLLRIEAQDLAEALGSVAENALRHARSLVRIRSQLAEGLLTLIVEDDGPGIPDARIDLVTERGVSFPQNPDSQGLGLALAAEIIAANGGTLQIANRADGLQVQMTLRGLQPVAQGPSPP